MNSDIARLCHAGDVFQLSALYVSFVMPWFGINDGS